MTLSQAESTAVAEVIKREEERCRAITEHDHDALESLLAKRYSHVHRTGKFQENDAYMEQARTGGRRTERRDINVRLYNGGDVAVMTGVQIVYPAEGQPISSSCTQVWVKEEGEWKMAATHQTLIPSKA